MYELNVHLTIKQKEVLDDCFLEKQTIQQYLREDVLIHSGNTSAVMSGETLRSENDMRCPSIGWPT